MKFTKSLPIVTKTVLGSVETELRAEGVEGFETYTVQLLNSGANPIGGFSVYCKAAGGESEFVLLKTTDYVGANNDGLVCFYASSDPATLAAGQGCLLKFDVSDVSTIRLTALGDGGDTTLVVSAAGYSYVASVK